MMRVVVFVIVIDVMVLIVMMMHSTSDQPLGSEFNPGRSCDEIYQNEQPKRSGYFWLKPGRNANFTRTFCIMSRVYGNGEMHMMMMMNFIIVSMSYSSAHVLC